LTFSGVLSSRPWLATVPSTHACVSSVGCQNCQPIVDGFVLVAATAESKSSAGTTEVARPSSRASAAGMVRGK